MKVVAILLVAFSVFMLLKMSIHIAEHVTAGRWGWVAVWCIPVAIWTANLCMGIRELVAK